MVRVNVSVGVGAWKAFAVVSLVACPHVGDSIVVGGVLVLCDRVQIGSKDVDVDQTVRFGSAAEAEEYFKK